MGKVFRRLITYDCTVSKSRFKAKALELFRQIEASGEPMIITDHGQPTLEVRRYSKRDPLDVLRGTVLSYRVANGPRCRRRLGKRALIVLDTHVLVWWAGGEHGRLTPSALDAIGRETSGGRIAVSSISAWELTMLVARGRLSLSLDVSRWLSLASDIEAVFFVPVDNAIAVGSARLPGEFHKDPADRMIVATARDLGAPVVTADAKIIAYPHVRTIW